MWHSTIDRCAQLVRQPARLAVRISLWGKHENSKNSIASVGEGLPQIFGLFFKLMFVSQKMYVRTLKYYTKVQILIKHKHRLRDASAEKIQSALPFRCNNRVVQNGPFRALGLTNLRTPPAVLAFPHS